MSAHEVTLVRVTRVLFGLSAALWAGVGLLLLGGSVVVSILDEPGAYDLAFIALTLVVLAVLVAALVRERGRRRGP